ncbi:aspartic proteinase-like protein 1 isoform X1 [Solanum tuberosum]|uniref:aspartic proteinase-like protein 1 isoform X1 n=2 Tax=Solanum tuberosum TaxID=4113 RepID=UPI000739F9A7|nr:PREDICTED: aspartic proteinase-like protein 1 isoform X1 [Solanum tuberosum]
MMDKCPCTWSMFVLVLLLSIYMLPYCLCMLKQDLFNSFMTKQGDNFYCVGLLPIEGMIGIIGQNFMEGYRLVFDWENMKLGWSHSKCQDIGGTAKVSPTPPPSGLTSNPLPTTEQQRNSGGHAVAPAIAGKATPKPSAASLLAVSWHYTMSSLLFSLVVWLRYLI